MEYVDLVNKIVSAEHSAQDIAKEVLERQESLDADLKRDVSRMREDYFARAQHRIREVEEAEKAAATEDIARWDRKGEAAMAEVEASYARDRDHWVETLFRKIVGTAP